MVYLFLKVKESNNTNYPINIQYFYILYIYILKYIMLGETQDTMKF